MQRGGQEGEGREGEGRVMENGGEGREGLKKDNLFSFQVQIYVFGNLEMKTYNHIYEKKTIY